MSYWKLGCNWGRGMPNFYPLLKEKRIVICGDSPMAKGDWVLICQGHDAAALAKKYGLTEEEFRYIFDPKDVKGESFPSESFRTLRDDELSRFVEYRTKRLALVAWERMSSVV